MAPRVVAGGQRASGSRGWLTPNPSLGLGIGTDGVRSPLRQQLADVGGEGLASLRQGDEALQARHHLCLGDSGRQG